MGLNTSKVRAEFPVLSRKVNGKRLVYFDNACSVLKPMPVIKAMTDFYMGCGSCGGGRSSHILAQQVDQRVAEVRQEVADFIGADSPNEVVFTSGTTESVNIVAHAFPFTPKKNEVILTDMEHNSVFLPFFELAGRGVVRLKVCPARDGDVDLERFSKMVSGRTAIVAVTHSSNVLGGCVPIAEVSGLAHRKGAFVLVDDAQSISSHREDVEAMGADFLAFSGHKIGGPFGVGVLYGKEHLLNRLGHYKIGGGTVQGVSRKAGGWEVKYKDSPSRLEAGIANYAGIVGLGEAIKFIRGIGVDNIRSHASDLVRYSVRRLSSLSGVRLLGNPVSLEKGSIVSFCFKNRDLSLHDFNLFLNHDLPRHVVAVRVGEHCAHVLHQSMGVKESMRLSFFVYNARSEVDVFIDALRKYKRKAEH